MKSVLLGTSMLALATALATPVFAADPDAGSEVIVTGTRMTGVKAADSAAPIEVVSTAALKRVGQPDLIQALSQNLPSFNAQGYGNDAAALTLSAALRGVSPNDTLVLINGKRRHTTGNLSVDGGSPYSGSATTDLGLIPVAAIDHVDVLLDGAAAQYGSDAIAGVVNFTLKSADHGGSATATAGQYYHTGGKTGAWSINDGAPLGDKGFVNFTLEEKYHEFSREGGADRRLSNPDGTTKGSVSAVDLGFLNYPGAPNMNNINGDPKYNIYNAFVNTGYDLGGGVELYGFASYSHRNAQAYENYRVPSKIKGVTSGAVTYYPLPAGFDPFEAIVEDDYSITEGIKGKSYGWTWDLSAAYGEDLDKIYTTNSANASLFPVLAAASATQIAPQRNFYDGAFTNSNLTANFDVDRDFEVGLATPLNVALGVETREDKFVIQAGEPSSYYGGGAQSFTGYDPTNASSHTRKGYAGYIDFAVNPIKDLHIDLAGRYAHFSDFGGATVGKLTARYDFGPMFALRGTIANGFRAPTLAEEYYTGTNVSPSSAAVQLAPNSTPATIAGFGPLKPEKSTNYSIGFVAHPMDKMQITLDLYRINITDRVINTGFIYGSFNGTTISTAVNNAITAHGNTLDPGISYSGINVFTNAADTRTDGAELTINYASDFGDLGHVDWSVAGNYNATVITKEAPLPAADFFNGGALLPSNLKILSSSAETALTTAVPKEKVILGAFWSLSNWSVNLRETVYGPASQLFTQSTITTKLSTSTTPITDLDVSYKLPKGFKIAIGANNLFDKKAPVVPNNANGRPADGGNVYYHPVGFTPWGINGGYYYTRLTLSF